MPRLRGTDEKENNILPPNKQTNKHGQKHTINPLTRWNAFVSAQLDTAGEQKSVKLGKAATTTTSINRKIDSGVVLAFYAKNKNDEQTKTNRVCLFFYPKKKEEEKSKQTLLPDD